MVALIFFILAQNIWIETTQEDFADGTFERNIYASHYDGGTLEFVPKWDLNNDGYIDLFTADAGGPYVKIFWGSDSGYFPTNNTLFPTSGAANCDAADLNNDGYVDFLVDHRNTPKITIYWGTTIGPDSGFYYYFPTSNASRQGVFITDFNKDGYLDIATGHEYIYGNAAIFWGSQIGYDFNNRTDLPSTWSVHNIEVADFNNDSWLDILLTQYQSAQNRIYWGSAQGFSPTNNLLLPGPGSHGASVADLNRDRYLDLIFTTWNASQSYIYWGGTGGYSPSDSTVLNPGSCFGGSVISHLNNDNNLDILYHCTSGQQIIFWGSGTGYSDNDTSMIGLSLCATGGLIADLNNDGEKDIFCNNFGQNSHILWGPSFSFNTPLPVNNDHHAIFREIGNVYNRRYFEHYISSVYDADSIANWTMAEWDDSLPPGTSIDFMVHTGNTPAFDTTWSTWFSMSSGDTIPDSLNSQYIQYMALLRYTNPAYLPSLYEVRISYEYTGIQTVDSKGLSPLLDIAPKIFTSLTTISYTIIQPQSHVLLKIYDVTGRCVKTLVNDMRSAGIYEIPWHGTDNQNGQLPQGSYFIKLQVNDEVVAEKTVRIR